MRDSWMRTSSPSTHRQEPTERQRLVLFSLSLFNINLKIVIYLFLAIVRWISRADRPGWRPKCARRMSIPRRWMYSSEVCVTLSSGSNQAPRSTCNNSPCQQRESRCQSFGRYPLSYLESFFFFGLKNGIVFNPRLHFMKPFFSRRLLDWSDP